MEEAYADGAYYYIKPMIEQQEFRMGVSIPSDFELEITHFELWCDQIQIGSRTPIDQAIQHLGLSVDQVSETKLRFYNNDQFVDDCVIDPDIYSGPLKIVKDYTIREEQGLEIGTYTMEVYTTTGRISIHLLPNPSEEIGYYRIKNQEGIYLLGDTLLPIETSFRHLSLVQGSEEHLTIEFFNQEQTLLYTGYMEPRSLQLFRNQEEP